MSKPKLLKLRAAPAYLTVGDPRIDRENLSIRDTVAMLANVEALGHGMQSDQRTLEIVLGLANRYTRGVKMHFGHTGMSENAMGRHIAWAKNFRIQGDKLVHDIQFMAQAAISPAFGQDPIEYILQMAENQPEDIAESAVIQTDVVWTLPDGSEVDGDGERPVNALTELPVMRPLTLYFVDVVADAALTRDGLLASAMFAGSSSFYSNEAFHLIDEFREEYGISLEELPRKVTQVIGKYVQSRGSKPGADMKNSNKHVKFEDDGAEAGLVTDVLGDEIPAETPAAETPAPVQDETSDVDNALETAKETESVLADEPADEPAAEADDAEPATVPAEQYNALLSRFGSLESKLEQVLELATINANNNKNLAQRIKALEGEPVATERIGGLTQLSTPALPNMAKLRKPTHVSQKVQAQGAAAAATSDPALASLAASQRRQPVVE